MKNNKVKSAIVTETVMAPQNVEMIRLDIPKEHAVSLLMVVGAVVIGAEGSRGRHTTEVYDALKAQGVTYGNMWTPFKEGSCRLAFKEGV